MHLQINTILQGGKYKIVRCLGKGSFGMTYLAKGKLSVVGPLGEMEVTADVAIKEFFMSNYNNRGRDGSSVDGTDATVVCNYRRKFRREAENLSKMNHPHIVKVLEVFDENNTTYYVMEFLDGGSLDDYVKQRGYVPEADALGMMHEICSALKYMHDRKMLHLDLKPKNIMRTLDGHVKLIDFGLSKQYDTNGEPESSTILGFGTPGYAPIEQVNYKQDGSFPATLDIYALGATFYKLLSGVTPPDSTVIINDGLPNLQFPVSVQTERAIRAAMEFRRKDRPQTVAEFLMMLPENDKPQSGVIEVEEVMDNVECENSEATRIECNMCESHAIDLGLSVRWSDINLGAAEAWQEGDLIGWGDVSGREYAQVIDLYPAKNPPSCISAGEYDIVKKKWGASWRMPTKEEQDELRRECKFMLTSEHGMPGYKVTGKNGHSIFLPFSGFRCYDAIDGQTEMGYYWSGTLHKFNTDTAYYLFLTADSVDWKNTRRYFGMAIRPVCD